MLNFIYYPVSAVLWFWHQIFGFLLGPASGSAWALAVAFLVFSLRAVLFAPFIRQTRMQRTMQQLQPDIAALRKKHVGDRVALAAAQQELLARHGVSPFGGCFTALIQTPVVFGLYHVLRSFNRTGAPMHLSIFDNAHTANYVFGAPNVQSFLDAKLFGAPLASAISSPVGQLVVYGGQLNRLDIAMVAVPLMVIAAVATHFIARAALARQVKSNPTGTPGPRDTAVGSAAQAAVIGRLAIWVFPVGVLVGGAFLPIAILIYWLSNNAWTVVQQYYIHRKLDRERTITPTRPGRERRETDPEASAR